MNLEHLGLAVLLSVPVGVGVSTAVLRTTGRQPFDPWVLAPGLVTAAVLFAFVVVAVHTGPKVGA